MDYSHFKSWQGILYLARHMHKLLDENNLPLSAETIAQFEHQLQKQINNINSQAWRK